MSKAKTYRGKENIYELEFPKIELSEQMKKLIRQVDEAKEQGLSYGHYMANIEAERRKLGRIGKFHCDVCETDWTEYECNFSLERDENGEAVGKCKCPDCDMLVTTYLLIRR